MFCTCGQLIWRDFSWKLTISFVLLFSTWLLDQGSLRIAHSGEKLLAINNWYPAHHWTRVSALPNHLFQRVISWDSPTQHTCQRFPNPMYICSEYHPYASACMQTRISVSPNDDSSYTCQFLQINQLKESSWEMHLVVSFAQKVAPSTFHQQ